MSRTVKQPARKLCKCERCKAGKQHNGTAREAHAKQDVQEATDDD